jgi:hypothetical protein
MVELYLRLVAQQNELETGQASESAETQRSLAATFDEAESDFDLEPGQEVSPAK